MPEPESKKSALPDGKTIDFFSMSIAGLAESGGLTVTRAGKVSYRYLPLSELSLGRQPMMHEKAWEIPAKEAAALLDSLVADGLFDLKDDGPHPLRRLFTARTGQWAFTAQPMEVPKKILERIMSLIEKGRVIEK